MYIQELPTLALRSENCTQIDIGERFWTKKGRTQFYDRKAWFHPTIRVVSMCLINWYMRSKENIKTI
jgi:hypothetical protein